MPNTQHLETIVTNSGDGDTIVKCFICRRQLIILADVSTHENTKQYYKFADSHRHCGKIYDTYHGVISKSQEAI